MAELDSRTFCVIGHPIGHTLSPVIHGMIYEALKLDFQYTAVDVQPGALPEFVKMVKESGCPGFNVTIPYKETVIGLLDETDEAARRIGAVNTVVNRNGILKGTNTDFIGLQEALKSGGWTSGNKVILLGAGGAARAAAEAMGTMGVSTLILFDIDQDRMNRLAAEFRDHHDMNIIACSSQTEIGNHLPEADLLINATPVGMHPKTSDSPLARPELIPPSATVFDMVYRPMKTKLLEQAESRRARTLSGLRMLVHQACAAEEIWLGRKIPKGLSETIWNEMKHQMENSR